MTEPLGNESLFQKFNKWINRHPGLRSEDGYDIQDIDQVVHQFKDGKLMLLEIKTNDASRGYNQLDTQSVINQMLRAGSNFDLYRMTSKQPIRVVFYGYFVIHFDKDQYAPDEGGIMRVMRIGNPQWWHMTEQQLVRLLQFDMSVLDEIEAAANT